MNRKYKATLFRTIYQSVDVTVEGRNEDDAYDAADDMLCDGYDLEWETDDYGDSEVNKISELDSNGQTIPKAGWASPKVNPATGYRGSEAMLA